MARRGPTILQPSPKWRPLTAQPSATPLEVRTRELRLVLSDFDRLSPVFFLFWLNVTVDISGLRLWTLFCVVPRHDSFLICAPFLRATERAAQETLRDARVGRRQRGARQGGRQRRLAEVRRDPAATRGRCAFRFPKCTDNLTKGDYMHENSWERFGTRRRCSLLKHLVRKWRSNEHLSVPGQWCVCGSYSFASGLTKWSHRSDKSVDEI